jgi:hypothetical protein
MILEVLTEVTLVASLGYRFSYLREFYALQLMQFGHEFVVTFLRHIFHIKSIL